MEPGQQNRYGQVLLCVALSVLLHGLLGLLIMLFSPQGKENRQKQGQNVRTLKLLRQPHHRKSEAGTEKPPATSPEIPATRKPTVKTSADTPQAQPDTPDYEGNRSTRATSAPDARHRTSAEHAPAMNGEEKNELVNFDQERQEGDLTHESKAQPAPTPPSATQPAPEPPSPRTPAPADGRQESSSAPDTPGQDTTDTQQETTKALRPHDAAGGALSIRQKEAPTAETEQHAARKGTPGGRGNAPSPPSRQRRPRVFYDPSLAEWAQPQKPGFRTHERRSRSSGRFILGKGAALNVEATPRGEYESQVYRRIAHCWYIACDDHRGDIIPGKITISLRIDKRGRIDSMALIKRSGASISQQSFTFKAIRRASLPPMPPMVQADVIGNLMELIFEFNFD